MQSVIEWVKAADRLPMTKEQVYEYYLSNGEYPQYIVHIKGAIIATALAFNGKNFFEHDECGQYLPYNVTYWAEFPTINEVKQ